MSSALASTVPVTPSVVGTGLTLDPSRYEVVPNVVVFAEHDRRDRRGRLLKSFKKADLEEAVKKSNARDRIGQLTPLTIGHTQETPDETAQPEIVGYSRDYRVVWSDRLKKWVVAATWYLRRERAAEARQYPRVSVEYWADGKFFDPIALLKRTPELDLGQWTYGRTNGQWAGPVWRYAMEYSTMTMPEDGMHSESPPPAEPVETPDAEAPEPGHHEQFMKCIKHSFPHLPAMHAKYAHEMMEPPPDHKPEGHHEVTPPPHDAQIGDERLKMAKQLAQVEAEKSLLLERLTTAERDAQLTALCARHNLILDRPKVLKFARGFAPSQWQEYLGQLEQMAPRDPAAAPSLLGALEPARTPPPAPEKKQGQGDQFTRSHLERAEHYMREHVGCSWEDAEEYAFGKRPLHGTPANGTPKR